MERVLRPIETPRDVSTIAAEIIALPLDAPNQHLFMEAARQGTIAFARLCERCEAAGR